MALSDLRCLRIRLLAVRLSLFWGAGDFGGRGSNGLREKKVLSLLSLKEKGNKDCLIAGYCQRHFVDFNHYISNITYMSSK